MIGEILQMVGIGLLTFGVMFLARRTDDLKRQLETHEHPKEVKEASPISASSIEVRTTYDPHKVTSYLGGFTIGEWKRVPLQTALDCITEHLGLVWTEEPAKASTLKLEPKAKKEDTKGKGGEKK